MRYCRAFLLFGLVALALGATTPTRANGWEHWGIPLDVLLSALAGSQPEHQVAAARSLGYRREPAAVTPLLDLVSRADTAPAVRSAAIESLGRIGDRRALPILHQLLRDSPREEVRADAATALGALAAGESLPELLAALPREPSLIGRAAIVGALGAWRSPEAIAALAAVLDDPRQRALRSRAINALGRMGSGAAQPLLAALRRAPGEREQAEIVEALGGTGSAEAVAALSDLTSSASPELRLSATVALGQIRDGSAVPTLIRLLDDPAAAVRFHAVRGLAEAGDPRAAEPLRALFRRIAAAHATDSPGTLARPSPEYLPDLALQVEIATTLIELDAPGSFALFVRALEAREVPRDSAVGLRLNMMLYELRRAATVGLGYSRAAEAEGLLIESPLRDRDFRLRAAAVRALGVLGTALGRAPMAALLPRLDDESPEVRWETAFVLGRLGAKGAIPPLSARLADRHAEVRRQAALSLGMLGAREAAGDLAALAERDPDERTRAAAEVALRSLNGR